MREHVRKRPGKQTTRQDRPETGAADPTRPSLAERGQGPHTYSDPRDGLEERQRFETLLGELSATFVNLPASQVDAQIESALRRLVEFLGVDRGDLAEVPVGQKHLVITHSYHLPGVPVLPRTILNEQLPWYVQAIYRGELLRLSDLPDDLPPEAAAERHYCTRVGLKSHVMIPLQVMGSVAGAIGFGSFRGRRAWPDDLIQQLRLVGEIFTNALARKQSDESLRQTRESLRHLAARLLHAQEEERRRIAREMHDDWTQRLAVLSIDITKLEKCIGSPEKALPLLHAMRQQLVGLAEDVHALSRQLHPSILDDLGLVEALRSECASFTRREGIAVRYLPQEVPSTLPKDVALCVYRVAQESLRNIAKHAGVDEAWVSLLVHARELVLIVEDQGGGFDAAGLRCQPGLGLSSMHERVRLVGAQLGVTSAPGQGTTVEVRGPLPPGAS
jgi:signal transduction histidine kinase